MAAVGVALVWRDPTDPGDAQIITPAPAAMARLLRLHAEAGRLAEDTPNIIANPATAHGLEQMLISALVDSLDETNAQEHRVAHRHHDLIMRRFRRVVDENWRTAVYVPEICVAVGVSARTLLTCCNEHLGVGPKQYLLLRRVGLVRRALRHAEPGTTTVTEILTRYGFWQFGRFAGLYLRLYGERPSDTLRRIAR
jgi:AraC family ethanolamine operon transcriptional activator